MKLSRIVLLLLILAGGTGTGYAQEEKEAEVRSWVNDREYLFKAQTALPMSGSSIQLTTLYTLQVSEDVVDAYLPYFGRAYVAPMDPSEGGIRFRSEDFEYTAKERKKGGWNVSIKPEDAEDIRQLSLSISASGYATLKVTSDNRQPISFYGYLTKIPDKKQKSK